MTITCTALSKSDVRFTADSLDDAAAIARREAGPVRVWRRVGERAAEVFFYRDLVIHAQCVGHIGAAAVRAMIRGPGPLYVEIGVWPTRHTMLIEWSLLRRRVVTGAHEAVTLPAARHVDEGEATVRLAPG